MAWYWIVFIVVACVLLLVAAVFVLFFMVKDHDYEKLKSQEEEKARITATK